MRILVIGGTRFVGRHLSRLALDAGHHLTLFHRGRSEPDPDAMPGAEHVRGDRDGDLGLLGDRTFDAVVDMCGYFPRVVRASVERLRDAAGHYAFVSSISVYDETKLRPGFDEAAPTRTLDDPSIEEITEESYGGLKVLCEEEVRRGYPDASLMVRPGLIVGPLDRSDRFTYWVRRVARGGRVLAPGSPDRPVQVIDARDLAAWMLSMVERRSVGIFNATGPAEPLTFGAMLNTIRQAVGGDATFEWVDEPFLLQHGVAPWTDLPVWLPASEEVADRCDIGRALAAGLTFRPMPETALDTAKWDRHRGTDGPMAAGLDDRRERALLDAWRDHPSEGPVRT
jgi:2'-hydroxyisoflavone reductase